MSGGMYLEPMLCSATDALPGDLSKWSAEAKLDGWRMIACKMNGDVHMYAGRNGSTYTGHTPIIEEVLDLILPPNTIVDGEMISTDWGSVQSAMTTSAVHWQDNLRMVLFDVLMIASIDVRQMDWQDRQKLIDEGIRWDHEQVVRSELHDPTQELLEQVLDAGQEGLVLKRKLSRYTAGRSRDWLKLKPQETIDVTVTGFKLGKGSFHGMVGALEFEMDNGKRSRCSGFNMELRQHMTENPMQWLGHMIEVKHHGISKDGKPRHPVFYRRRDDRTAT